MFVLLSFPRLGILGTLNAVISLILAGPLLIGTVIFFMHGEVFLAGLLGVLAIIAIFLPSYIIKKFRIRTLVPNTFRRPIRWLSSRKP